MKIIYDEQTQKLFDKCDEMLSVYKGLYDRFHLNHEQYAKIRNAILAQQVKLHENSVLCALIKKGTKT